MSSARLVLTDRDIELLQMVFAYGGASVVLLQARFWPRPGSRSPSYARISRLIEAQYLHAERLPSQSGIGSGPLFLTIGPAARPLLARRLGCPLSELRRVTRMRVPAQIHHHLAICDFRLSLELAVASASVVAAVDWTPEWELRKRPLKVTDAATNEVIPLIPDGRFALSLGDGLHQSFVVEIDRATITEWKRLRRRLRGYLLRPKAEAVPVLFVVPTNARRDTLSRLTAEEAAKLKADSTIFWMALQSDVSSSSVLSEPIWQVVGGPSLALLPERTAVPSTSKTPVAAARQEAYV